MPEKCQGNSCRIEYGGVWTASKSLAALTFLVISGCSHTPPTPARAPAPQRPPDHFDHWPAHERRAESRALRDHYQAETKKRVVEDWLVRMSHSRTNAIVK